MPFSLVVLILGLVAIRALTFRGGRRWRHAQDGGGFLAEKVTRLEAQIADLQEQLEQDRAHLARLEEEREFLRQLYPTKEPAASA